MYAVDILPFAFFAVCVVFAEVLGCVSVVRAGEDHSASLTAYLNRYIALLPEGESVLPTFFSSFCDFFLFPVFLFFSGFTALGVFVGPLVISFRVFLLSYAISSFFHVFGPAALTAVLAVFGLDLLVSMPVLFAVGFRAFLSSLGLARGALIGQGYRLQVAEHFALFSVCSVLLLLAVCLQWSVMPQLLVRAAANVLS